TPSMINTQFTSSPFDNFPSFSSSLLNQPSSAPATVPTQFQQPFFVPSSSSSSNKYPHSSSLAQQHDFAFQSNINALEDQQHDFSPSPSSNRFPSPISLHPVASPLLSAFPHPSPTFRLDSNSDPANFSLPPPHQTTKRIPPSTLSLIDLPAIPLPSSGPIPSSSPPSPPPVALNTNQKKKKRRTSSTSSTSSHAPTSPPSEDPEERISPITGKAVKQIAKRGWPPKDQAKRIYYCKFEGCKKNFGRPSALNTHMRSHDGAKPFLCPIPSCARALSVFSNLKRHMLIHNSVDFRTVTVNDLDQIRWVVDEKDPGGEGGRLEWIDQLPGTTQDGGEGGMEE
ncbi:hypothetical protein JCM5353_005948, partial [Sporobolomyces roseus]